jgi:phosphatidylglycerol:prolipoprotein diacylglycerol transferase
VLQPVLTPSCWLDPGEAGDPFTATIWFSGRRADVTGRPGSGDAFTREETVTLVPGTGPVAVTVQVNGITEGEWQVAAQPVTRGRTARRPRLRAPGPGETPRVPGRRIVILGGDRGQLQAAPLPFVKIPGISRFVYPGLVTAGVLAGLALQAVLLADAGLPWAPALRYSLYAVATGLAGAKTWYTVTHQGRAFDGWCVQGFVAGAAALAAAAPATGLGIPAGAYYATAAAGLLTGMGIGRPGCFWAGCCVGRPTAGRWGIWSSDRHTGCRRVPVQFLEALLALACGAAALAVVLLAGPSRSGPVAIVAPAAYTLGRQFLLGLRASPPRRSARGGRLTALAAGLVLLTGVALLTATLT